MGCINLTTCIALCTLSSRRAVQIRTKSLLLQAAALAAASSSSPSHDGQRQRMLEHDVDLYFAHIWVCIQIPSCHVDHASSHISISLTTLLPLLVKKNVAGNIVMILCAGRSKPAGHQALLLSVTSGCACEGSTLTASSSTTTHIAQKPERWLVGAIPV